MPFTACVIACAAILVLRKPDAVLHPQLYAEDGPIFFDAAYQLGWKALFIPYAGYLHLVPRIVAAGASSVDPAWIPSIYAATGLAANLSVVAALFHPRVGLPVKPALALAYVLTPHTGEVLINLVNIQWSLAVVVILLLIADDPRGAQAFGDAAVLALCGLTGPFVLFLSPLFFMRAAIRRTRASFALGIVALSAASAQGFFIYKDRLLFACTGAPDLPRLLSIIGGRLFGTFLVGYSEHKIQITWTVAMLVAGSAVLCAIAIAGGRTRLARLNFLLAMALLVLPVAVKYVRMTEILVPPGNGDRYFWIPHVLTGWLLVLAIAERRGLRRSLPCLAVAAELAFGAPYLRSNPSPDLHWKERVAPIRQGLAFEISINPEGWKVSGAARPAPMPENLLYSQ